MRIRKRVIVKGIVQGVGFRWFTRRHATRLGLGGFVKNMPDGSVLVEIEGDPELVNTLIDELKRGPSHAVVEEVIVEDVPIKNEKVFRIAY